MDKISGKKGKIHALPRNVRAVSLTSFFIDVLSEMVFHLLSLFLANVLGARTAFIGLTEGVAEATASLLKIVSGWLSDRLRQRKWLAVIGYGLSVVTRPFFYIATGWGSVARLRWADRVRKGIRTAPRDELVADSIPPEQRGLAFGFHRAVDTSGAALGIAIALGAVWMIGGDVGRLTGDTFRTLVLISTIPAFLAVLSLIIGVRDVPVTSLEAPPKIGFSSLGKPFVGFMVIIGALPVPSSSYSPRSGD